MFVCFCLRGHNISAELVCCGNYDVAVFKNDTVTVNNNYHKRQIILLDYRAVVFNQGYAKTY
jgi:hypothetical protein